MGRARKKIEAVAGEPSAEGKDFPPNVTTSLFAGLEAVACRDCMFGVDYLPRVPNGTLILRCQRFPQPVEILPDYWCGEYREKANA
jgi:hypothetical protein